MDGVLGNSAGTWLAVTSVSFDISVLELLWTVTRGFKVVLHGDEDWSSLADEIRSHGVTHLQMTPSLARMMMLDARAFAALSQLKTILLGGEAVPASLIRRLRQTFQGLSEVDDPTLGWSEIVRGRLEIRDIPANHLNMLTEPNVHEVARVLAEAALQQLAGAGISH